MPPLASPAAPDAGTLNSAATAGLVPDAARPPVAGRAVAAESFIAAALVEANEQLILAALRAQRDLESAALALQDATHAACSDLLTDLPNRLLLFDRVETMIARAKRESTSFAALFIDLDGFKGVNDTFGHAAGDHLLQLVARDLCGCVRAVDTVSRYGGDEFVIVLAQAHETPDTDRVVAKIRAALAAPHPVGDQTLQLSASIGIAVFPRDGRNAAELIDRADAAMYRAKAPGRRISASAARLAAAGAAAALAASQEDGQPRDHPDWQPHQIAALEALNARQREANEQLVLAAITAQELRDSTELAHRRQNEFLAVLAHELRAPLGPISTAAAMLGHSKSAGMLPVVKGIIERQVAHVSRLIEDLLDSQRIQSGKLQIQWNVVDLQAVVASSVQTCQEAIDARRHCLVVDVPHQVVQVAGDAMRLTQVVNNLLGNAAKYTPPGGTIRLELRQEDMVAVIVVTDTGIGVSAEALPLVFDPFVQDEHAAAFNRSGLGIGLTVARELVLAHHGELTATSAGIGCGSRFEVRLPLAVPRSDAPAGEAR